MGPHTEGMNKMGKRFAIVIGATALGVMALGAQTATAAPDVVKYDTELTIAVDRAHDYHGHVNSKVMKCKPERRVILFKVRPGADRKLGTARSQPEGERAGVWVWGVVVHFPTEHQHGDVYAKVRRKVPNDRFVCHADRSKTLTRPGETDRPEAGVMALGAQTATSTTTGERVDRVPGECQLGCPPEVDDPDLQLWGEKTDPRFLTLDRQKLGKAVKVKVGCGDEACTVSAEGKLYWRSEDAGGKAAARMARPDPPGRRSHEINYIKHGRLKPASAEFVGPRETTQLKLKLTEKRREKARKALDNGPVVAEVIVYATDAAGNEVNAQAGIKLLKHHPRG